MIVSCCSRIAHTRPGGSHGKAPLLFLLEDARNRLQSQQHDIDASMQTVDALTRQEYFAEAVKFLEAQNAAVQESEPAQTSLQQLRAANDREFGCPPSSRESLCRAGWLRRKRGKPTDFWTEFRIRASDSNRAGIHGGGGSRLPIAGCLRRSSKREQRLSQEIESRQP